eukprot:JP446427.1.p1 GENE.JP446427.1~~JP446427.1.p1  ORF type:complete len:347 (+),score=137.69 JP446427.1:3-1043(+)
MKVCIAGGGGFIGSHMARRLKGEGHHVICADWKKNEYFDETEFCNEFHLVDLRSYDNCAMVTKDCDWVFNFAADMGGMGFIQSNHSVILYNNSMISYHMIEAATRNMVKKFFFASSACIYPEHVQLDPANPGLKESMAWPANPQDAYGLEKIATEEMCKYYGMDNPHISFRVGRFHNIYGPYGTWCGGREKSPAAFCRKAIANDKTFDMWGDGLQTRSFCYVDDAVEGVYRLMQSDHTEPINIGSEEMVSMNQMADMVFSIENKKLEINHIPGPEGVRGRNSDNTILRQVLKWEPEVKLQEGLTRTYKWIQEQINKEKAAGINNDYTKSHVVATHNPSAIGTTLSK